MKAIAKLSVTILTVLQLSACASIQPIIQAVADPTPAAGYVAGVFNKRHGPGFALGIVNIETREEFIMPFGRDSNVPVERKNEIGMIALPPGEYKISFWSTYATLSKELLVGKDFREPVSTPFILKPGSVVFLGSYSVGFDHTVIGSFWDVKASKLELQSARTRFSSGYPKFSNLPFSCIYCTE